MLNIRKIIFLLFLLLLAFAGSLTAQTPAPYFVSWDTGNDANDGLTWQTAFKTVGKACDAIGRNTSDGRTYNVYMAKGRYTPSGGITLTGNKTIRFIGGFPVPNEFTTGADTCNICVYAYPAIIDIEPSADGSVIRIGPSTLGSPVETQSTNVYFKGITFDNNTTSGGAADGTFLTCTRYSNNATITMEHCYIKNYRSNAACFIYVYRSDNHTFNFKNVYVSGGDRGSSSSLISGGGFFRVYRNITASGENASKNITLNVENCVFTNNITREVDGGTFFKVQTDEASNGAKAVFRNNKFCENGHVGTGVGTCIYIEGAEEVTLENNTFSNNDGRALVHLKKCYTKSIKNNVFYDNISTGRSGVAYSFEGVHNLTGPSTDYVIDGDKFYGNYTEGTALGVADAGAINALEAPLVVKNSIFIGNYTTQTGGDGGAIFANECGKLEIDNCYFKDNESRALGGAIYAKNTLVGIQNSIFIGNKNTESNTNKGGAIFVKDGVFGSSNNFYINNETGHSGGAINHEGNYRFLSTNDVFYGNKAGHTGGISATRGGGAVYFYLNEDQEIEFNRCDFLDNLSGLDGGGIKVYGPSILGTTTCELNKLYNCRFWDNTASSGATKDVSSDRKVTIGTNATKIKGCHMQHRQNTYPTTGNGRFIFENIGNSFGVNPNIPIPTPTEYTIPDASEYACPEARKTFIPHIAATVGTDTTQNIIATNICVEQIATTKLSAHSITGVPPFTFEFRIDKIKPGMTAWQTGAVQTLTTVGSSHTVQANVPNENLLDGVTYRYVGLKVTDARGIVKDYTPCDGTHFININVNPKPKVSAGYTYACPGPNAVLNATFTETNTLTDAMKALGAEWENSENVTAWQWTGPNGFTSTEQNPTITNLTSAKCGVYTVTVTDNNGCTNSASVTVTLNTTDTDGDGVLDLCDLDNDNDGILDADELYCNNPNLPVAITTGKGKYKTQLGFFDFTGATWNAIGNKVTRTATYNGVTYTAEVTYIDIYNKVEGHPTIDIKDLPNNPNVPKFEGWDMNTWDVTNQPQMIKNYYNVNGTSFKEAIYYNKNAPGAVPLFGEASFKIDVKAHVEGQPDNPVPFQLVVFDAEGSGMEAMNNWYGQIKYTDLQGQGFQLLEKTGTANFNDVVTVSYPPFSRTAQKVELSPDNRILSYNHTANLPGLPSNVNGMFETIDYTSSNHSVRVDVKARSGCQGFGFAVRTLCDTDSDGTPDFLDLDSDGDGCFDAIEGTGNVTPSQLTSGRISGTVDANGVPTLVGADGQGVGYSKNPLINACTDTDGDGVPDINDLDNDNDGILDADELYCHNPDLPVVKTVGRGQYKTQLGFFDFTGAQWNAIGDKVTRTATYNGITYTAEITYIDIYNKVNPGTDITTDLRDLNDSGIVPQFIGYDMNTWNAGPPQMIKNYYNVNGTNFKEAIWVANNLLFGEATFKVNVKAEKGGQPVPFQLVVYDAEASGFKLDNNWPGQIIFTDMQGKGFQSLEKTGTGNYNETASASFGGVTYTVEKIKLSNDNRILYYNHTNNSPDISNVNGLFQTIDYTSSNHIVKVALKARGGAGAFGIAVRTLCDADSDGKPNFLDLDSDGDGCYDAIEGDENVAATHLNANGSINIASYGGVNADGVPNLVNSGGAADIGGDVGQGAGYSKNPLVNACTDTDGDGVPDINDLDNDNDGILDSSELHCNNPDLPIAGSTIGSNAAYGNQLGFFNFAGKTWNTIGQTHTVTATYNGVTYTAEVTYYDVDNRAEISGTTDFIMAPVSSAVPPFVGHDINTWAAGPAQMIHKYYNAGGADFKEAIAIDPGNKILRGEAKFWIKVSAEKAGQPVPFKLVVFDAEATSLKITNNFTEDINIIDFGKGFQLLEKTGTAPNYTDPVTATASGGYSITVPKIGLSANKRKITYNYTDNNISPPSNVNALFETIDHTLSEHKIEVRIKARGGGGAFGFAVRTLCDTDSDGKPNYLDLDSDGDGCPDAIEGDENVTAGQLNANGSINITTTGGVNANGVPNLVNSGGAADIGGDEGQGIGTSLIASNISVTTQPANVTVCSGNTAVFTATVNITGTGSWTYQLQRKNGATWNNVGSPVTITDNNISASITNATESGTYRFEFIGVNNPCPVYSNEATLTVVTNTMVTSVVVSNADCFEASTGSFKVTVTGGTPNYTYKLLDEYGNPYIAGGYTQNTHTTSATTHTFSNLPAGFYIITVTDSNGCVEDVCI
ncbi:MAG: hypothetical protein PHP31_03605 [Lentimicrobiaceae bacterium]|nr:hypothetical protein [Lentimicrobiaceae bacterium]